MVFDSFMKVRPLAIPFKVAVDAYFTEGVVVVRRGNLSN